MDDDDHGRKSHRRSCGRHCDQARRLMRVSTTSSLSEDTPDRGDSDNRQERGTPQPEVVSNAKKKDKKKKREGKEDCDDEYMLQNLHKLKCFIRRVWNYAWCYTQYCYPALRTVEYYKKVKRVCKEREKTEKERKKKEKVEKAEKKKKDDKKKNKKTVEMREVENKEPLVGTTLMSTGVATSTLLMSDNSTQTSEEDEWSDLDESGEDHDNFSSGDKKSNESKTSEHAVHPFKILPALKKEFGWGEYVVRRLRRLSQSILNVIVQTDQDYQIGVIIKFLCLILAPAVMWLGVNYIFLKRKYKSLSGKLRKIKEENNILKKESSKLESMLLSTEKLKMPFSTKESRRQVVAEFTRLAESRIKSKKEITRLTTEKQALLEELKTAKRQRDVARSQFSTLTQGVDETINAPYLET